MRLEAPEAMAPMPRVPRKRLRVGLSNGHERLIVIVDVSSLLQFALIACGVSFGERPTGSRKRYANGSVG
jgi:hypothetical protein